MYYQKLDQPRFTEQNHPGATENTGVSTTGQTATLPTGSAGNNGVPTSSQTTTFPTGSTTRTGITTGQTGLITGPFSQTGSVAGPFGQTEGRGPATGPIGTGLGTQPLGTPILSTGSAGYHGATGHQGLTGHHGGTFIFKPLEAKFLKDTDIIGKMDPYCKFKIGYHSGKSTVARNEGTHPTWVGEAIPLERKHGEQFAKIKVKESDRLKWNERLGDTKIALDEVAMKGNVRQWFPLTKRGKVTGEILLEIDFQPAVMM